MYKCPLCNDKFNETEDLYGHIEDEHSDSIPKNFSASQYYYFLKTGKEHGNCVVCKMPTKWNDSTNKYARFCEMPKCKETYKEEFKKRMIGKYGKVHLLNDPDQQRKMLANRSISGEYEWSDNRKVPYTGSYELDFLKFLDVFMHFESEDVIAPSPHTYYYMYEGEEKFYIPDVFIASLNLEVEIKDGGDNPNTHHKIQGVDKVKEKLKDDVMMSQKSFNYIKITDKKYDAFFDFMMRMKKNVQDGSNDPIYILNEHYHVEESKGEPVMEFFLKKKEKKFNPSKDLPSVYSLLDGHYVRARVNFAPTSSKYCVIDLMDVVAEHKGLTDKILADNARIEKLGDTEEALIELEKLGNRHEKVIIAAMNRIPAKYSKYPIFTDLEITSKSTAILTLENHSGDKIKVNYPELTTVTESVSELDSLLENFIAELNEWDKDLGEDPEYKDSEVAMELFYGKEANKAINQAYNYTDRFKFGFLFKNFDLIFSNMLKRAQQTGNFAGLRENLLEMAERCKKVSDINYLRRDLSAAKVMLTRLAKNRPDIEKECLDHIRWIDEVYRPALNERAKQLRGTVQESFNIVQEGSGVEDKIPVFVLLTHSGTVLSNAIKSVTKNPYSHSSISFDSGLENMYSFGRKYKNNPLIGVFVKESIKAGLYEDVSETATYSLYVTFVTKEEKQLMEQRLQYFKDNRDVFKYDFTGLILHQFGKISERDDAYFCSGFVTNILSSGKEYFDRHYSLVKPYDFAKHKEFHFVTKGLLKNYNPSKVDSAVHQLRYKLV